MSTLGEADPFVVLAAWHCNPCDVQGRSLDTDAVACWNCNGDVTVTARPAVRLEDMGPMSAFHIPAQRRGDELAPA